MACALTQSIPLDCRQSVGGIKSIFVTNLLNQTAAGPVISGGTVVSYALQTGFKFFRYDFRKQTGEWTETETLSDANWTQFYDGDIKIQFTKIEVNKQQELYLLGQNDLVVIILDNNGQYWLTSSYNGATLSKIDGKSGKTFGDFNGYQIEIKYTEPKPAYLLPAALLPALLVPAP